MQRAAIVALLASAKMLAGQINEKINTLLLFCRENDGRCAKWIKVHNGCCSIHVASFDAADLARDMLWKNMRGCVLSSATLAPLGEFGHVFKSLGMPKETLTRKLSSPFDFSRSRIIVPRRIGDALRPGHVGMMAFYLRQYAFEGEHAGGLVYFTSRRKMYAVYEKLTDEEKEMVLMQGRISPCVMSEEHRKRIDEGKRSYLFGMDSIAEGVDLPGAYCSLVALDKLPFPMLDDPVMATHAEYLKTKGGHPFHVLMLPYAGQKLAQICGRLNRHEDDWGDILVLDRRLIEKPYGALLLRSTPFQAVDQI